MYLSSKPALFITATSDINTDTPDVNSIAFSRDGSALITATGDDYGDEDAVWVWDAATGELLARIPSETDIVQSAAFHPDGTQLGATHGNHIDIWVADPCHAGTTAERWRRTATPQRRLAQTLARPVGDPTGRWDPAKWGPRRWDRERLGFRRSDQAFFALDPTIFTLEWHPDGSLFVTASSDEVARIWDTQRGQLRQTLSGHTAAVRSACFSSDGTQVLTASADSTARIWDVASGTAHRILSGHAQALHSAEWSTNGAHILTTCSDGMIGLWDAYEPDRPPRMQLYEPCTATIAAFSPDGARIAISHGTIVRIWDHQMARCQSVLPVESQIPGLAWGIGTLAWSPDSTRLAIAGTNAMAGIWNVGEETKD